MKRAIDFKKLKNCGFQHLEYENWGSILTNGHMASKSLYSKFPLLSIFSLSLS